MRTLIVGCGAIGGIFAAHLARFGDVVALDPWSEHVMRINDQGLRISGRSDWVVKLLAVDRPQALVGQRFDFAIWAVKSIHTRAAAREAAPYTRGAIHLSVQNGIGNEEILVEETDGPVCQGVTMQAGAVVEPGHVRHELVGKTWLGPFAKAGLDDARRQGEWLTAAGLETEVLADPRGAVWSKLLFNAAINALSGILRAPSRDIVRNPGSAAVMRAILRESKEVAERLGIELIDDPEDRVFAPRPPGSAHLASMGQDIVAGRSTEIEFLNGAIAAKARELGVAAPANELIAQLVRALEWQAGQRQNGPPEGQGGAV